MGNAEKVETLLRLLKSKNHLLEKFYTINEVEIKKFQNRNFEGLDLFYNQRENILESIRMIDFKIQDLDIESADLSQEVKMTVKSELNYKDHIVGEVLDQDLIVIQTIEEEKSQIIRELSDSKKTRQAIQGYKSPQFKKRLDEEA
jgi:hypothetical protein